MKMIMFISEVLLRSAWHTVNTLINILPIPYLLPLLSQPLLVVCLNVLLSPDYQET